jgi:endonuclease YncB( thermonuclease family)
VLWWRKRNEGFEWRDYVRTTILVRREQRRQRVKDVQAAAASHVKEAGKRGLDAGIAGAKQAGTGTWYGLKSAGRGLGKSTVVLAAWTMRAARAVGAAIAIAAANLWSAASALVGRIGEPLSPVLDPVLALTREPRPNLALKIIAAVCAIGAAYRTWTFGFDGDAIVATVVFAGAASLLLLAYLTDPYRAPRRKGRQSDRESLLTRLRGHEFELPGERRFSGGQAGLAVLGIVAVATAGVAAYSYAPSLSLAGLTSAPRETGAVRDDTDPSKLEGRAVAVTGDMLRISGTQVLLDGIEAPEAAQSCRRNNGTWSCGAAAKAALADLVRGRRVTCDILGEEEAAKRARCFVGGNDIAEDLVRSGSVFAQGGFWSSYASVESEAETRKVGLWAGEADRPQDYRDKRWEEAKKAAPEGCPIKGPIRSGARTYILPWAPSYDSVRLRVSRGERWFCSESEAEAAGWTRGTQS